MHELVVTHPFADHAVGDKITDAAEVKAMSHPDHPNARFLVRVAKPKELETSDAKAKPARG